MEKIQPEVCRLCLLKVIKYEIFSGAQQDMVQIVVPEMNIGICTDLFICEGCSSTLQETFSFKSTCLEIEDTIHNYTNNGQIQVNLDKITGLKELEIHDKIEKNTKICRTCLNIADPLSYIILNNNDSQFELEMLNYSLPEVDTKLTKEPILCKNCLQSLEKQYIFHKRCVESENRIWSYLQEKSDNSKKKFKLIDLFQTYQKNVNQNQNREQGELLIHNDANEHRVNIDNLVSLEKSNISMHPVLNNTTTKNTILSKDSLLEELDTAILSCEDNLFQSKSQRSKRKILPNNINDLIDEVSDSQDEEKNIYSSTSQQSSKRKSLHDFTEEISDTSDEEYSSTQILKKPYNTRNKRKKIVVDAEDNMKQDPDFDVDEINFEDDSDDDYIAGSEKFGWLPKSRKSPKDAHSKRLVIQKKQCKFCQRQVFTTIMAQHLVMCSKNPQNNLLVECAHCGMRMFTMQRLEQHMIHCQEYIRWKLNKSDLGTTQSSPMDKQVQHSVTVVYDIDQEIGKVSKEDVSTTSFDGKIIKDIAQKNVSNAENIDIINTENIVDPTKEKLLAENNMALFTSNTSNDKIHINSRNEISQKVKVQQNILLAENLFAHGIKNINGKLLFKTGTNLISSSQLSKSGQVLQMIAVIPGCQVSKSIVSNSSNEPIEKENVKVSEKSNINKIESLQNDQITELLPLSTTVSKEYQIENCINSVLQEPVMKGQNQLPQEFINKTATNYKDHFQALFSNEEYPTTVINDKSVVTIDDEITTVTSSTSDTIVNTNTHLLVDISVVEDCDGKVDLTLAGEQSQEKKRCAVPPRRAIMDSLNYHEPITASISSDITTTDYVKSELMRMSASFITEASTQFLGVLKCDKCSYNTRHLRAIENHLLTHFTQPKNNENYFCVICHKLKSGLYNFLSHMKETHKYYFYKPFYWCVKCADVLRDIKEIPSHECKNKNVNVKMFKSNGVVFCMLCKFESDNISEAKQHIKLCELKSANLQPCEIIEIDDD